MHGDRRRKDFERVPRTSIGSRGDAHIVDVHPATMSLQQRAGKAKYDSDPLAVLDEAGSSEPLDDQGKFRLSPLWFLIGSFSSF